ncbi:TPA: hypothetical protein QCN93_004779 [Bacillus pacificus]|nr:hypothetical protein [Bacillus pacificus]
MNEEKMQDVLKDMKLNRMCYGKVTRFPRSFHEDLTEAEKKEVFKRYKKGVREQAK